MKYLYVASLLALTVFAVDSDISEDGASKSISAVLADPSFVPYTVPNQKIEEFIALGDSYTAGTGCNGNNEVLAGDAVRGKRAYPMQMSQDKENWQFINVGDDIKRFSFHAYTGDTTKELVSEQLKQGAYKDNKDLPRTQPFGKPQIAVLTIGGNDATLSTILNDCIYRAWWPGNCDDTLKKLEEQINNGGLQDKIEYAMYKVADAGRQAGGANPRESFQTFVLEYITFFDDAMSPECNDYTWAYWPPFISNQPKLTKELREKLNDFTRKVNKVIKDAAKNLEQMGVIYVEGLQDKYKGHRYCEPGANLEQTEAKVWFWTHGAHFNTPSEGPGDPNGAQTAVVDPAKQLLYFVFPGDNKVVPTSENEQPPWKWEGADKYPDFESLLKGIRENGDVDAEGAPFNLLRTFHPKATAYKEHVKLLFGAIADNREVTKTGTSPSEGDGEVPCVPSGGPMATGYVCQCTTTVSGELYVTKTDMIDGACTSYTTYPGPVTKAPPAPTQGPVKGLYTTTTDGTVLAYESYSESSWVLGFIGKTITNTYGVGAAKTLSVPPPTQTGVDNRGSGQCSTKDGLSRTGLREACDRAISKFEDDTIYDKFTSRYSRLKKGILMTASVWQAACYVNFACDDYGIGMSGKLIKEAREYAKANDGIGACGHIKLSNSCELKFDYCTKCKTWN